MEFIYKGKKQLRDITEFLADFLEENNLDLNENDQETFVDLCQKNQFLKTYYTEGILNFDKILDDKDNLSNIMFEIYT